MTWPLPITPRRWQAEALPRVLDAMRQRRRPVVQAATGSGKSILLAAVCKTIADSPKTGDAAIVVTTPTEALVTQLAATIGQYVECGRYYGKRKEWDRRVVVCCTPSLGSLVEALTLAQRPVVAWLADECHKGLASDGKAAEIERLAPRSRLGVTATPWRTESPINGWDSPLLVGYGVVQAIRDGAILPPHVVHWTETGREVDRDEATIAMLRAHVPDGWPVVVSAPDIADAEAFAARMTEEWKPTEAIHSGKSRTEIEATIARLKAHEIAGLVHVKMLVEGADYPWLRALVLREGRPPLGLVQEVGRVLRVDPTNPDKTFGLVLDPLAQLPPTPLAAGSALLTPAALGDLEEVERAAAIEAVERQEDDEDEKPPIERVVPLAVAVRDASRWAASLVDAALRAGLVFPPPRGRHADASEAQVEALERWLADRRKSPIARLPPNARDGVARLAERPGALTGYAVSAILSVGYAAKRRWIETAKRAACERVGVPYVATPDRKPAPWERSADSEAPRSDVRIEPQDWRRAWQWPAGVDVEPLAEAVTNAISGVERVA